MELEFFFVITARESLFYAKKCLESIEAQVGSFSIQVLYVNDDSNYSRSQITELSLWLKKINGSLLLLSDRHYQIGALSKAIPLISNPYAVVCLMDGDDYLLHHALQTVSSLYQNQDTVMSYGNALVDFRPYQDPQPHYFSDKTSVNTPYPSQVWESGTFREDGFRCFHLKTFRRWLWDYLNVQDFCRDDGTFFRASGDSAFIFPFLELLNHPKHVAFNEDPIYVYRLHAGNVHNHDKKSQSDDLNTLRFHRKKYLPLDPAILAYHIEQASSYAMQEESHLIATR
ncbi:MAG: glycosyltransferase family A protein [Candidatus Rhabdochlamydia sp.]